MMKKTVWQVESVDQERIDAAYEHFSLEERKLMDKKIKQYTEDLLALRVFQQTEITPEQLASLQQYLRTGYIMAHLYYSEELINT